MTNIISKNLEKKEFRNTLIAFILAFFVLGAFLIIPDSTPKIMLIFMVLLVLGFLITINFRKLSSFATYKPEMPVEKRFIGFDKNIIIGLIIGIIVGFGFIWLQSFKALSVLSLSIPSLPYSISASAFIVKYTSPLVETLFFAPMLSILYLFMPFGWALFIRATSFMLYHYWSYVVVAGATISSVSGAFISAFIFSILAGLLAYNFGAESDFSFHSTYNIYNYSREFGSLSVVG